MRRPIEMGIAGLLLGAAAASVAAFGNVDVSVRRQLGLSAGDKIAFVDLNNDGKPEILVYLNEPEVCGSGGCDFDIFTTQDRHYRLVTHVSVTRLPIRILPTTSNGWSDLGVVVGGGGIKRPYEARLMFDGKTYPDNPSVPPARRLSKVVGRVVLQ